MALLDNLIGFFSPKAKFRRLQYLNAVNTIGRKYEGAARTRRTQAWFAPSSSANTETANAIETLRNRARDMVRNNPYAARAVSLIAANVVGKGITANIVSPTEALNDRHDKLWLDWVSSTRIDQDCALHLDAILNLIMKSVAESGEVLIRRRRVGRNDAAVPIRLQVLESDFLATNQLVRNTQNNNRVIQGIEVDDNDRPVAYHLFENHPGNSGTDVKNVSNILKVVRVPAEDIIHIFRKDRPGQLRGVTWLAPIMIMLRELDEYSDAMLVSQKVAACFSAFIHDIEPPVEPCNDDDEFEIEKLEPGIIEHLPPGKDIKFGTPPLPPAGAYDSYVSTVLHAIATGLGVSYESLTSNYERVNFSSGRMGWLEFNRNIDSWRCHMLIPQFLDRIFVWFKEAATLIGENMDSVTVSWTPPRREMIDPSKEINAKIHAIRAGIETLSDVIRQNGKDPSMHFQEIKYDNDQIDKLNLTLDSDPRKTTMAGQEQIKQNPALSEDDGEETQETNRSTEMPVRVLK